MSRPPALLGTVSLAVSSSNRARERLRSWALGYLAFSLLAAVADWVFGLGLGRWASRRLESVGWEGGTLAFSQSLFLLALPGLLLLLWARWGERGSR